MLQLQQHALLWLPTWTVFQFKLMQNQSRRELDDQLSEKQRQLNEGAFND